MARLFLSSALALIAMSAPAFADDLTGPQTQKGSTFPSTWKGNPAYNAGGRVMIKMPEVLARDGEAAADPVISPYIYLNRCTGGCIVHGGSMDDARTMTSQIPADGDHTISEYEAYVNGQRVTGSAADAEWNQVVQCMKEVYSPFNITVTDTKPVGVSYTMGIIAGHSNEALGAMGAGILGIAPMRCAPLDNVISFSFANDEGNGPARVFDTCWTAAQETAHAFGLDHEYMFSDGTSACNDPMTYRFDCGGQKFFRNKVAQCGEMAVRTCSCGGAQNSHVKIRTVFGDGTSLIPAPSCNVTNPGATVNNGAVITVQSGSRRGVAKVELWLNGYKWVEAPGAKFGANGQPDPSSYSLTFPANIPDGKIDVAVKCYDDLGLETDGNAFTVTKGNCSDATSCKCLKGQQFADGKCFWDAPVGELGAKCEYPQYCKSGICTDTDSGSFCTTDCIVGSTDGCPMDYECIATAASTGQCLPKSTGGCCSATTSGREVWAQIGLGGLILGLIARRRRRR